MREVLTSSAASASNRDVPVFQGVCSNEAESDKGQGGDEDASVEHGG